MPEPPEHVKELGKQAQRAYRRAFNSCVSEHGSEKGPNHNCFAIATAAAKKAAGRARVKVRNGGS